MTASGKWIVAIAGLLAANVVAMTILAVAANNGTNQVIPDYDTKAARFDDELARAAASHALGWRVELAIHGDAIEARVTDAAGQPLDGARVRIAGYQRAHAADPIDVALVAGAGGRYLGAVRARAGRYDLVAVVDRGGAHYTQQLVIEAR